MTNNEILTLAQAGFTAQQIAALAGTVGANEAKQNLNNIYGTQATPQPTPIAQPAQMPESDVNSRIMAEIQKLQTQVQANAIAATAMTPKQRTTDDILAEIINPPEYNKSQEVK